MEQLATLLGVIRSFSDSAKANSCSAHAESEFIGTGGWALLGFALQCSGPGVNSSLCEEWLSLVCTQTPDSFPIHNVEGVVVGAVGDLDGAPHLGLHLLLWPRVNLCPAENPHLW